MVFDLECRPAGHRFEGWFASSDAFTNQREQGLVACPACGSADVGKALTAPRLARKGNQIATVAPRSREPAPGPATGPPPAAHGELPAEAVRAIAALAQIQAAMLEKSQWVGGRFAEDARAIHYGESEAAIIHGQASAEEAQELLEEGIAIIPLPFPIAAPGEVN